MTDWRDRTLANRCRDLLRHEAWNVGAVRAPIHVFLGGMPASEVHWLPRPPEGRFLADPFGIVRDGRRYVFFEEYDFGPGKGVISCVDLSSGRRSVETVMRLPVHASYPYVFERDGAVYCVPETHQAREVRLYEARDFPRGWRLKAVLIRDFPGVDSTVFEFDGLWWLMCTHSDLGSFDRLYLWHAPGLLGPWEPHPRNPVKVDLGSARPGGTPFVHRGDLYRPSQDCSRSYGGRNVINRVTSLTTREFREEPVARVEPPAGSPYPAGLHTLSSLGDWTLIDGKRFTFVQSQYRRGARC